LRAQAGVPEKLEPVMDVWNDTTGTTYSIGTAKAAAQSYNAGALFMNSSATK
jgi:hypothetical protein